MNECEGLDQEIYDLYVLDLLESPLSQLVKTHLNSGCPACHAGTGQALNLWTGMALSAAQASEVRPNAALKRRIMKSVEPARATWVEWFLMRETWAVAAMAVVISGATVWFYGHGGGARAAAHFKGRSGSTRGPESEARQPGAGFVGVRHVGRTV